MGIRCWIPGIPTRPVNRWNLVTRIGKRQNSAYSLPSSCFRLIRWWFERFWVLNGSDSLLISWNCSGIIDLMESSAMESDTITRNWALSCTIVLILRGFGRQFSYVGCDTLLLNCARSPSDTSRCYTFPAGTAVSDEKRTEFTEESIESSDVLSKSNLII
jgi:hypothetical protein